MDTTTFRGHVGDLLGQKGHSKDYRPHLNQMVITGSRALKVRFPNLWAHCSRITAAQFGSPFPSIAIRPSVNRSVLGSMCFEKLFDRFDRSRRGTAIRASAAAALPEPILSRPQQAVGVSGAPPVSF